MSESSTTRTAISELAIPLERDVFLRTLLRHLAGTLQNVVGYSRVVIEQAIARGDAGCRVVVNLKLTPEAQSSQGREYFQG